MKDQPPILAIKLNSVAVNDPCAICGDRTDPELGPELFLEGTWALVCYECGSSRQARTQHWDTMTPFTSPP
jgi:hypothetical protein